MRCVANDIECINLIEATECLHNFNCFNLYNLSEGR